MSPRPARLIVLATLSFALPSVPRAMDFADGKFAVNGNGSWAFRQTDHNRYLDGDPNGAWNTAMFDLLVMARPTPQLSLTAQMGFEPPSGGQEAATELEWAFAEWRISDLARVRLGKSKHPFGNYAELQFVGTTRPFFDLATGTYGPADVAAKSYSGVGVAGEWHHSSDFGVQYDAYGGAMEVSAFVPWEPPAAGESLAIEEELVEDLVGGRLSLLTPWDLTVRFSGFTGHERTLERGTVDFNAFGPSVFFRGEKLWLSIEGFRSGERGASWELTANAEAAWFLTQQLQVAARYDWTRAHPAEGADLIPSRLLRHEEVAVGVNWWFSPQLVVKVSVHQISGERFVIPEAGVTPRSDRTVAVVSGTQFTF